MKTINVLEDIGAVREAAGKDILKVIIEAPQLTEEEITQGSKFMHPGRC